MNEEDFGRDLLKIRKKNVTKEDFALSFNKGCYWICMDMLM